MKRIVEIVAFLGLAGALHLLPLAFTVTGEGASASGAEGTEIVSLQAASAQTVQLLRDWQTPPEVTAPETPSIDTPLPPQASEVQRPRAQTRPASPMIQGRALPQPDAAPTVPDAPTSPPPPPSPEPDPEPKAQAPSTRPMARPARSSPAPKATPAPRKPSKASSAQRAAGSGGGTQAGERKTDRTATLSKGQAQAIAARWGAQVRTQIERRKRYPSAARGQSGTVSLRITLDRRGALLGAKIVGSSGIKALDAAALRAVQAAGRFPPAPKELTRQSFSFTLPMTFNS